MSRGKMTELEQKLAVSLQRTEEMTALHQKQNKEIAEHEASNSRLLEAQRTMKKELERERHRGHSLVELNEALKRSVMNLH